MNLEELQQLNYWQNSELALGIALFFAVFALLGLGYTWFPGYWKRRLKGRDRAMRRQRQIDRLICDAIVEKLEDFVHENKLSTEEAQARYRKISLALDLDELLPKELKLKRKGIRALKAEVRKLRKNGEDHSFGEWDKNNNGVPIKKGRGQHSLLNKLKPAA